VSDDVKMSEIEDPIALQAMPTVDGVPIVAGGSNSDGEWVRFADGTQIVSKKLTGLGPINTSWGDLYISAEFLVGTLAASFIAVPMVSVTAGHPDGDRLAWGAMFQSATTTTGGSAILMRAGLDGGSSYECGFIFVGRWLA